MPRRTCARIVRITGSLHCLDPNGDGWLLIDMPGLREIQLWAQTSNVDSSFEDIQQLAQSCRFRNCSHSGEPGCAINDSVIDPERLDNYRKLQCELDYLDRKLDKRLLSETKAR